MPTPRARADGGNAAGFYAAAHAIGFALLMYYRAPIFHIETTADAAALAAGLAHFAGTLVAYVRLRAADPGFLGASRPPAPHARMLHANTGR